jgi:hypothetical protein
MLSEVKALSPHHRFVIALHSGSVWPRNYSGGKRLRPASPAQRERSSHADHECIDLRVGQHYKHHALIAVTGFTEVEAIPHEIVERATRKDSPSTPGSGLGICCVARPREVIMLL